jgi:endonuclease YncB( thermonuclease family)
LVFRPGPTAGYRDVTMRTPAPWSWIAVAAIGLATTGACGAQERISGRAQITDGDSFEIGATRVRLFGVDAPEGRQPCTREGREWPCGDAAAAELRRLVGAREVVCVQRDEDDYGRAVAVCRAGTTDLGAAMVRAGLALAYRRFSSDYVDEENEARVARRGVWAGEFTRPEEWRRESDARAPAQRAGDSAPSQARRTGCDIKGNINGEGEKIYHTRDSPSYGDTRIDESRGEQWFCTEAAARAAGWRAPRG